MERIDLEGVLYNEDGTFKPLTASHGNINGELAHLRNTYMEAERRYFEELLSDEETHSLFVSLIDSDVDNLFNYAMKVQERIENGDIESEKDKIKMRSMTPSEREEYHLEKLEKAEGILCLLLAATRDKAKILEYAKVREGSSSFSK